MYKINWDKKLTKLEAKGLRSPVNCQLLFNLSWSALEKHRHQRCKAQSQCNTYSLLILFAKLKIEGDIFLSSSQRLSYNVYLKTSFSQHLSNNVFLITPFSQRLTYIFFTTSFSQYISLIYFKLGEL